MQLQFTFYVEAGSRGIAEAEQFLRSNRFSRVRPQPGQNKRLYVIVTEDELPQFRQIGLDVRIDSKTIISAIHQSALEVSYLVAEGANEKGEVNSPDLAKSVIRLFIFPPPVVF